MTNIIIFLSIVLAVIFPNGVYAQSTYTVEEVATHNTSSDCWMIYDGSIYDVTNYLSLHDRYLDITGWCGEDITNAFTSKGGIGEDHKTSSYSLLETFKIGDVQAATVVPTVTQTTTTTDTVDTTQDIPVEENKIPYNILAPVLTAFLLYLTTWFLAFKKNVIKITKFNGFWNTILILSLLIPSFGFGLIMILKYQYPTLLGTTFDFMYWHVELSLFMTTLALCHFIQRFVIYKKEIS